MAYTSPTDIDLVTNATGFFFWLAEVTNFWFYRMMMIAIASIILFNLLRNSDGDDFLGAFSVASYVTWGLATLLVVVGLIPGVDWAIITGVMVVATILLLIFHD